MQNLSNKSDKNPLNRISIAGGSPLFWCENTVLGSVAFILLLSYINFAHLIRYERCAKKPLNVKDRKKKNKLLVCTIQIKDTTEMEMI